jgi:poly-gamma-glutamate capsule biosynthesis protein CapA/YwtB (metallophosphatase superfamily)
MRVLTFILRAGVVVVVLAALFSYLDDGSQRPAADGVRPQAQAARQEQPEAQERRPAAARRAVPPGTVTIAAVGDIVMGSTPRLPPRDGAGFFSGVSSELAGDVVLGNLDGTLSTGPGSKCGEGSTNCYAFQMPPSYARHLRDAGFTVLNLANNHAYDFGVRGLEQTVAALERQRLLHTGRPGEIALQQVGELTVAIVGFASYPWAQSITDFRAARALVRQADRRAHVVIAMMHAGAEGRDHTHVPRKTEYFLGENRGNARAFSHAVIDAGADLVIGHSPHVLRGMEWYRGRLIAYSMGNFAGYKVFALGGPLSISGVLRVTLRGDGRFEAGVLVPTRLDANGIPVLDPAEQAHGVVRALSRADFGDHAVRVSRSGALS